MPSSQMFGVFLTGCFIYYLEIRRGKNVSQQLSGFLQSAVLTSWCTLAGQWESGSLCPKAQHPASMCQFGRVNWGADKR